MKEEHIPVAAQILTSMKDSTAKLESAMIKEDSDEIATAKKEILDLQKRLEALI
jgi:hypothetical protein